jgi:DNA polymerase III subunit delta
MKIAPAQINAKINRLAPTDHLFYFYGTDQGKIDYYVGHIYRKKVAIKSIPKSIYDLKQDPKAEKQFWAALLQKDLLGGDKFIIAKNFDANFFKKLQTYIDNIKSHTNLLLCAAGANKSSKAVQFCEAHPKILSFACYENSSADIKGMIQSLLTKQQISISSQNLSKLSESVTRNPTLLRQQLANLLLYLGDSKQVDESDIDEVFSHDREHQVDEVILSLLEGKQLCFAELEQLMPQNSDTTKFLRIMLFTLQRMHMVKSALNNGIPLVTALSKLKPPLFWKTKARFIAIVQNMTEEKLRHALDLIYEAEKHTRLYQQTLLITYQMLITLHCEVAHIDMRKNMMAIEAKDSMLKRIF